MRNAALFCLFFLVGALLGGCGPHWIVVKQATPNPMNASSKFFVAKVALDGLRVGNKSEEEWMAEKGAETRDSWDGDKLAMNDEFATGFVSAKDDLGMSSSPAGAFTVKAHILRYEPGFYVGVASGKASLDAAIQVLDQGGTVVDEFQVTASAGGMSAGERSRQCARILGATAAKYVLDRIGK